MSNSIQSPSNTVLIIAILALIVIGLLCCGCMSPKNQADEWCKDLSEGVSERTFWGLFPAAFEAAWNAKIVELETRLLPMWASGVAEHSEKGIAGLFALWAAYMKVRLSHERRKKRE